jgi:hypothetical protein
MGREKIGESPAARAAKAGRGPAGRRLTASEQVRVSPIVEDHRLLAS